MNSQTGARPNWYEALAHALRDEAVVLEQLDCVMASQAAAIAAQDDAALHQNFQAIRRIVRTFDEAKKRRASVVHYLTGREDLALDQLEFFLGDPLPINLDAARAQLWLAAQSVAREAQVNKAAVRRAKDANNALLQELFSAVARSGADYGRAGEDSEGKIPFRLS